MRVLKLGVLLTAFFVLASTAHAASPQPVLVYTKEIKTTDDPISGRAFPTVEIWKKVGSSRASRLGTVGKIGEYPYEFKLSPDHRTIAINTEKAIKLLDVRTRKIRTVGTAKYFFENIDWSPDGRWILGMDHDPFTLENANKYRLIAFRATNGFPWTIRQGRTTDFTADHVGNMNAFWRSSSTLLVQNVLRAQWYVKTGNGRISAAPAYANTSTWTTQKAGNIDDFCAEMTAPVNKIRVLRTSNGSRRGLISSKTRAVGVRAIKPDGKQALYYTTRVYTSADVGGETSNCPRGERPRTYFVITLANSRQSKVTDISRTLASWKMPDTGADLTSAYDDVAKTTVTKIVRGSKTILSSPQILTLVAQYWK